MLMKKTTNDETAIREAVGIFNDAESLKDAIAELLTSGCKREELGLLASEKVVEQSLGDLYTRTNADQDSPDSPAIAFVERDSIGEAGQSIGGGLFFIGTSGVMGGVVASGAVLGGALLAAVGGIVAVGVVGALVARVIHQSDAEFLQQQIDEGRLLLFVRVPDAARERQVMHILEQHSGTSAKMYEVPVQRCAPMSAA
jgi:outer membrane lipoprotein SlyB